MSLSIHCYHCLCQSVVMNVKLKQLSRIYVQKIIAYNLSIGVRQSAMHWFLVPGQDSQYFCPLHLGIRVAKENTARWSCGWNDAILTMEGTLSPRLGGQLQRWGWTGTMVECVGMHSFKFQWSLFFASLHLSTCPLVVYTPVFHLWGNSGPPWYSTPLGNLTFDSPSSELFLK